MKILNIVYYDLERPNGIKTVLTETIPIQKVKGIITDIYNMKISKKEIDYKYYDLIIFHGIYSYKYLLIYKKIIRSKVPYIIIPHCSFTKESLKRSKLKKIIFNNLAKKFYKNASSIGFLNIEEKENSIKTNKDYIILPNGINLPDKLIITKKKQNNIKKEKIKIIALSRIDIYHKGLDLLLEAVSKIKKNLIAENVEINIYGNAFYEKNLKYLIEKIDEYELHNIVKYLGRVDGIQKENVFLENDIFVLTSRFEGFPMAVLEALSYGLPCILTEGTNMKSIIEKYNSGWICKIDVEEISKLILKAINDYRNNPNKYIENALKNAKNYEWKKIVDNHLLEYKKEIAKERKK